MKGHRERGRQRRRSDRFPQTPAPFNPLTASPAFLAHASEQARDDGRGMTLGPPPRPGRVGPEGAGGHGT